LKTATVTVVGESPLSWGKYISEPRKERESDAQFEERCWKHRLHHTRDGQVVIPAMAFKRALEAAAKYDSRRIKGKNMATYTKRFVAGLLCTNNIPLGIHMDNVVGEKLFVPSNGVAGAGKRVMKCFPRIDPWEATVEMLILDDKTITEEIFESYFKVAGLFIGIGRFRPERGGFYGRFRCESFSYA